MRTCVLFRKRTSDDGTFGRLVADKGGKEWKTGELPWRENERQVSCIPAGQYSCKWDFSPHFGHCYHVNGVPNRDGVLIHAGNFCGDVMLGKKADFKGCIGLAKEIAAPNGQKQLIRSREALAEFVAEMAEQPFTLIVYNPVETVVDVEGNTL